MTVAVGGGDRFVTLIPVEVSSRANSFVIRVFRLLMTHGYMLSGMWSNVYIQNLCQALAGWSRRSPTLPGTRPLSYDFVNGHYRASGRGVEKLGEQATPYPGSCHVY